MKDGFISRDNQIAATYLHGLFDTVTATQAILSWAGSKQAGTAAIDLAKHREQQITRLADSCEAHLDWQKLMKIIEE